MTDVAISAAPPAAAPPAKTLDKKLLLIAGAIFVAGWFLGQAGAGGSLPWAPKKERPILTALARIAKMALWVMVVEPVPEDLPENRFATSLDPNVVNHRRGW